MKIEQLVVTTKANHKIYSEDSYYVSEEVQENGWFFAVVTDGHGPQQFSTSIVRYADYVAVNLYEEFMKSKDESGFNLVFDAVAKRAENHFGKVSYGATALCIALRKTDSFFTVAHVGDCRLYRFASENMSGNFQLTADHHVENPNESQRIRVCSSVCQVQAIAYGKHPDKRSIMRLAVGNNEEIKMIVPTRGFGDYDFHPVYTHVPEVRKITFESMHFNLFALCSDGGAEVVRNVFKNLDVTCLENFSFTVMEVIKETAEIYMPKRPVDDITIIFFLVHPSQSTS